MKLIPQKPSGFLALSKTLSKDGGPDKFPLAWGAYAEQEPGESLAACARRARALLRSYLTREGIEVRI